ncbi:MAG: glutamate racemase [Caulobacteraceae bacterium]
MAIGVFDSGIGGLSIHRTLAERFPHADLIYFADQANCPIGSLSGEEIVEVTKQGCIRLFEAGASLVILGCNTACSIALRRLQQTWLPAYRCEIGRPVNVLGIIVPTIEAATGLPWNDEPKARSDKIERVEVVGVFCTAATAGSRVYEIEIDKRAQDVAVFCEPCTDLARMIEAGATSAALKPVIEGHVAKLSTRIGRAPDRAILGCTHYEIVADLFVQALKPGTPLIHQPSAVADALAAYLQSHPEYSPGDSGSRRFITSGAPGDQNAHAASFWGVPLRFEAA